MVSMRNRRAFTSTFFLATFFGAIMTVGISASPLLACPAKTRKDQAGRSMSSYNDKEDAERILGQGERVKLTRKGGWIEIEDTATR
jgi:hypothetical protein